MIKSNKKILIIDGYDRRALSSVRCIGRNNNGIRIDVGSYKKYYATKYSKYCNNGFVYPDPDINKDLFLQYIVKKIKREGYDVLIPMDDEMSEIVSKNHDLFDEITNILLPPWETFKIARDKKLTLDYAEEVGIRIPRTFKLDELTTNIEFPLIIKPRVSTASIGLSVIDNWEQLETIYNKAKNQYGELLIQEMIKEGGKQYQCNLLFDKKSNLIAHTIKEKIRQYPVSGGPATFFKTTQNDEIRNFAVKLLSKINWIGPAEVEFITDSNNENAFLMEINPRMSANIGLSCFAGVNIPDYIVKLLLDKQYDKYHSVYKKEYYCQWLIPGDIMNFVFNKDRLKQEHGYITSKPENLCHMTYDKDDAIPFVVNILTQGFNALNLKKLYKFISRS